MSPSIRASSGDPIRVGIIGVGAIAREHVEGYLAAGAEIAAVSDLDPAALAARAREWGVERAFPDYGELLRLGDVDVVSVCTPNAVHHAATLAAAASGKHVLCEKPVSLSLAEAEEMIAACRRAGVVLQVNHHLRSNRAVMRARSLIESGELGRICSVRLRQAHDWSGRRAVPGGFGHRSLAGGGTLLDNGCHLFDLARHLAGPVAEVFARVATLGLETELEDTASVSLLFESGALGQLETAWTATGWENGFWIHGTRGALECTNRTGRVILRHVFRGPEATGWADCDATSWEIAGGSGHAASVASFLAAVRGERNVVCSGEDGREAVRLVLASYESARLGQPISLGSFRSS